MEENFNQNQKTTMQEPKKTEPNKKEPSAKTKRKKAKIAVICLCSICAILLGMQIYAATSGHGNLFMMIRDWTTTKSASGKDEVFADEVKQIEEQATKELDVNSNLVKKLYNYILKENSQIESLAYQSNKVTVNDLENDTKLCTVLVNLNDSEADETKKVQGVVRELTQYIYDANTVKNKTKEIFGDYINIQYKNVDDLVSGNDYTYKDGKYIKAEIQQGGGSCPAQTLEYIIRAEQDGDIINIYDKFVYIYEDLGLGYSTCIYKDSDRKSKILDNVSDNLLYDELGMQSNGRNEQYNKNVIKKIETVSGIKAPTYKHTFKKNSDGNYYWYSTEPVEEIKEEANTSKTTNISNNNDKEADFFENNANMQYNEDLTNPENGKAAIIKSGEEILITTQNNGYYTYTDMWNNSYNIKKIKDVKSKFIQLGKDKQSALYKCTIYYIDNNNQDKSFDVAVIVAKDAEGGIAGTFDSYTGSTSYTRWSGLYDENEKENNTETRTNISNSTEKVDNYVHYFNWVKYNAPGVTLEYPTELKLEKIGMENKGQLWATITGTLVGRDVNTNQPVYSNIKIKIFNPTLVDESEMNSIIYNQENGLEAANITTNTGIRWYEKTFKSGEEGYNTTENYYNFDKRDYGVIEMRQIWFETDNRDNFKVTNLINHIIGSTELTDL